MVNAADIIPQIDYVRLKSLDDKVAFRDLSLRLALNVGLICLMFHFSHQQYSLLLITWYIYSSQFHFWGYAGIGHEALHDRVFSHRPLNAVLYTFCSALTWNNGAMFRKAHLLHHRETFSERDTEALSEQNWRVADVIAYLFIDFRLMFRRLFYALVNAAGYYPNLTPLEPDYKKAAQKNIVFNSLFYSVLGAMTGDLLVTTLLFSAPFTASLLNKVLAKAQHHHLGEFREEGPLSHSRTLRLPRWLTFLYANMNFHAEHHLFPAVPYYNLPRLHAALVEQNHIVSVSLRDFMSLWWGRV